MRSLLAAAAIGSTVVCVVTAIGTWVKPPRRLASRVRPYSSSARIQLGLAPEMASPGLPASTGRGVLGRLIGPIVSVLGNPLARFLIPMDDQTLSVRLRQAGLLQEVEESARPRVYRMRTLSRLTVFAAGLGGLALVSGGSSARVIGFGLAGISLSVFQARFRLAESVRRRREAIRAELYTINQLVAMYVRVGGGPIQGLRYVVGRAHGIAVEELSDAIHLHERGWSFSEAMARAEQLTPEPEAARTYRLLATAQDQGTDLSEALLGLSADLRALRRDGLRREAARRRILIVIPIVVVLAPITMLFMAAPIPTIVFGV